MVFLWFDKDTLDLGPFAFFGLRSASRCRHQRSGIGRHTRGAKRERPAIRAIPLSKFEKVDGSISSLRGCSAAKHHSRGNLTRPHRRPASARLLRPLDKLSQQPAHWPRSMKLKNFRITEFKSIRDSGQ